MSNVPVITVLVCAYNEQQYIGCTLQAICDSLTGKYDVELVLINDSSTDDTSDIMESFSKGKNRAPVTLIHTKAQMGVAGARNIGWERARGKVLVSLDAHCVPGTEAIERMAESVLSPANNAVIAGANMVVLPKPNYDYILSNIPMSHYTHDMFSPSKAYETISTNKLIWSHGMNFKSEYAIDSAWAPSAPPQLSHRIGMVMGNAQAILLNGWEAPEGLPFGFDEGLGWPWGDEDNEICLRAWRLGYSVVSTPNAYIGMKFTTGIYGLGGQQRRLYGALRKAFLYLSPDGFEETVKEFQGWKELPWAIIQLMKSDSVTRRAILEAVGPTRMKGLVPLFQELGGPNVLVGKNRQLFYRENQPC